MNTITQVDRTEAWKQRVRCIPNILRNRKHIKKGNAASWVVGFVRSIEGIPTEAVKFPQLNEKPSRAARKRATERWYIREI